MKFSDDTINKALARISSSSTSQIKTLQANAKRAGVDQVVEACEKELLLRGSWAPDEGQATRAIQLYMGHRNIQNTVIYTQLSSDRFKDFGLIKVLA